MRMVAGSFRDGPLVGLRYRSPSGSGVTDEKGRFVCRPGESITFSIAGLDLGRAVAAQSLTVANLAGEEQAPQSSLRRSRVTNLARFVQSFGTDWTTGGLVRIGPAVEAVVDSLHREIDFNQTEEAFGRDPVVLDLLSRLGLRFRSSAAARNHLRRAIAGIRKITDVAVPTRDGSYLLADVYRPVEEGRFPVIMRLGIYGKAFGTGVICGDQDYERAEKREDKWFEDDRSDLPPLVRYSENVVSANASTWVPRGYVLMRIDGRGVGKSPGALNPFSQEEAEDYYDAIEWAATQPWSNGKVGLYGASYNATIQWNVAALRPPALQAIMPFAGDADAYRDLSYPGGIFNEGYRQEWWDGLVARGRCPGGNAVDLIGAMRDHPFDDSDFYGPRGSGPLSADFSRTDLPVLMAVSQTSFIHARSGFEAFAQLPSCDKRLIVVDANYYSFLYQDCLPDQEAFFDQFLKGVEPRCEPSPVRLIMRTGYGEFEWRDEPSWPIPGTSYRRVFLEADATGDQGSLRTEPTQVHRAARYSADAKGADPNSPVPGSSFLSAPLTDNIDLAGHFGATLWVSSTSFDMDVFVAIRVIDEDDQEVPYAVRALGVQIPLTSGCIKVSQRKLDPARSTAERPWHTHVRGDRLPLRSPDEIVEIEVELMAATARLRRGHRVRVDITPIEGPGGRLDVTGHPTRRAYERSYHDNAWNYVHTGGIYPSSIRLPVVPFSRTTLER